MDDHLKDQIDQIVEDEVRRGYRVLDLPTNLQAIMKEDREIESTLPEIRRVRFTKLTPRKRRLINESVVRRYHADLQNKELLSMEQLRRLNVERGEWSIETEKRMEALQSETGELARDVLAYGYNEDEMLRRLTELSEQYQQLLTAPVSGEESARLDTDTQATCWEYFTRWYLFDVSRQEEYDLRYGTYSEDQDFQFLSTNIPGSQALDVLTETDTLREIYSNLRKLIRLRRELVELQLKQAKMFSDCVEQRRDQTEEYARVYYTTERLDDAGKPSLLAKTVDDLWTWPEEVIAFLITESYFFLNGIPDSVRPYLEQMGFLVAPPRAESQSGSEPVLDVSPAEPVSKPDILPQMEMLAVSSE